MSVLDNQLKRVSYQLWNMWFKILTSVAEWSDGGHYGVFSLLRPAQYIQWTLFLSSRWEQFKNVQVLDLLGIWVFSNSDVAGSLVLFIDLFFNLSVLKPNILPSWYRSEWVLCLLWRTLAALIWCLLLLFWILHFAGNDEISFQVQSKVTFLYCELTLWSLVAGDILGPLLAELRRQTDLEL